MSKSRTSLGDEIDFYPFRGQLRQDVASVGP